MLIGLSGKARSGKDTAGAILHELSGYNLYSFASSLKDICGELFSFTDAHRDGDLKEVEAFFTSKNWDEKIVLACRTHFDCLLSRYSDQELIDKFYDTVIDPFLLFEKRIDGIREAVLVTSPRKIYQNFGTEFARGLRSTIWIDLASRKLQEYDGNMIVTDVRFENEAQWVKLNNGKLLLITRNEAPEVASHISEDGFNENLVDVKLINNDTLEAYKESITTCFTYLLDEPTISI